MAEKYGYREMVKSFRDSIKVTGSCQITIAYTCKVTDGIDIGVDYKIYYPFPEDVITLLTELFERALDFTSPGEARQAGIAETALEFGLNELCLKVLDKMIQIDLKVAEMGKMFNGEPYNQALVDMDISGTYD